MDYQLQVITLPVSDVDKAAAFYTQQAGFTLDVDYHPAPGFRRRDYASFADFADPDGNAWVIQEIGYRPPQGTSGSQPPN
jgi:catechol 2,3-dioxygenase-like lactoylglutathione lyase family enzyme